MCYGSHGAKQVDNSWAPWRFSSGRARKWPKIVLSPALEPRCADIQSHPWRMTGENPWYIVAKLDI